MWFHLIGLINASLLGSMRGERGDNDGSEVWFHEMYEVLNLIYLRKVQFSLTETRMNIYWVAIGGNFNKSGRN